MKSTFTTLAALTVSAQALAHPGHDHTAAPGGEMHHILLLIGAGVALGLGVMFAAKRIAEKRRNK